MVRRRFGPLPVSGVCSDLATSYWAPSCRGDSADAVWCQIFVRCGLLFNLGTTEKLLFTTFAGYIKRRKSNYELLVFIIVVERNGHAISYRFRDNAQLYSARSNSQ